MTIRVVHTLGTRIITSPSSWGGLQRPAGGPLQWGFVAPRDGRAHRPARTGSDRGAGPGTVAIDPPSGQGAAGDGRAASDPRVWQLLRARRQRQRRARHPGDEGTHQPALLLDEASFLRQLISGFIAYPRYYREMAPINRRGPEPIDLRPARGDPEELARRRAAGEWIVDLRPRTEFAGAHIDGWINIEGGDSLATYLGGSFPGAPRSSWPRRRRPPSPTPSAPWPASASTARRPGEPALPHVVAGARTRNYPVVTFADLAAARARGRGPRSSTSGAMTNGGPVTWPAPTTSRSPT